jgi:aspartate/methionine/tyrosine aminotransferase
MSSLQLADRLNNVEFSEIVIIRNKILALQRQGASILEFHGGEPFPDTPQPIKDACWDALSRNKTRYAPSSGIPELLHAIVQKVQTQNHIPAEEGNAIVVSGGAHGLFGAFLSFVNPGDEVLVISPYWTPIRDLIAMTGGRMVLIDSLETRGRDAKTALERALTPRTRAIYLNSPCNPTGRVYSRTEIEALAEFARASNLVVVADEAYEHLQFEGEHISIASLPGMLERTITVFTFSKSYAMTGWRIGYVVATEPWMTGLRKLTLNSTNGVSTPTQWAALAGLQLGSEYFEQVRNQYRQRRDLLVAGLRSVGFDCETPAGAFYAFPRVSARLGGDSWRASDYLLETAGISTVPGAVFGPQGEGHLRLSFSTSLEVIAAAVERLQQMKA